MRARLLLATLASLVSFAPLARAAGAPKAPIPLDEYFKIRRIGSRKGTLASISHDEKSVAYLSDEGGRVDIWIQPVTGGLARQLTHVTARVQRRAPVSGVEGLRGAGAERARLDGLRQELHAPRRPRSRRRSAERRGCVQEVVGGGGARRSGEGGGDGRQLRWLHGAGGSNVRTDGVRGAGRLLRRL